MRPKDDSPLKRRDGQKGANGESNDRDPAQNIESPGVEPGVETEDEENEEELIELYVPEVERRSEEALVEYLRLKAEDEALEAERMQMRKLMEEWRH